MLAATPPPVKPHVRVQVVLREAVPQGRPAFGANLWLFGPAGSCAFQRKCGPDFGRQQKKRNPDGVALKTTPMEEGGGDIVQATD